MASPVSVYGLAIKPGKEPIPPFDVNEFPGTFRITMAALDPSVPAANSGLANGDAPPRATLKMIKVPVEDSDDEDDEDDEDDDDDDEEGALAGMLDDDDSDDDEEVNGGPSDPKRSPKALKMEKLMKEAAQQEDSDDEMADGLNGILGKNKGKGKAILDALRDQYEDGDDDDDSMSDPSDIKELVLCTLDPASHYQQTLDITIPEHELSGVYFQVTGTHTIYITGNIMISDDDDQGRRNPYGDEDEDDDSDFDPDMLMGMDGMDYGDEDDEDESDELDDMDDPRVTEVDSDEEEDAPKLTTAKKEKPTKNQNNKRPAEDSPQAAKSITPASNAAKSADVTTNGAPEEQKLSKSQLKKQRKKLKDNAGNAVEVATATKEENGKPTKVAAEIKTAADNGKADKKVTFAKNLVQGPSNGSAEAAKTENTKIEKAKSDDSKQTNGAPKSGSTRNVNGITIYDKTVGSGPQAKKGDRLSMRYIGRLDNKTVFDSNKKGPPFKFKLGTGEVIKGWDIGLQGLQVGGERRVTVPANMGYGNKKAGDIPPNSTLTFEVKLLKIE